MFEDSGDMRITKSKSVLRKKLQVEVSGRMFPPDAIIVDGCAVLWLIQWPTSGNVEDYIKNLMAYIIGLLHKSDIFLSSTDTMSTALRMVLAQQGCVKKPVDATS